MIKKKCSATFAQQYIYIYIALGLATYHSSSLADPCERTVIEYSDRSLTVLRPFYDLALLRLRSVKKTLKALQL